MNPAPPPLPVLRQSSPTTSPVGRPPAWVAWLLPGVDLSENPLYIRLSGQGYGRRGFWRRQAGPIDFRATSLDWLALTRTGLWPFLLNWGLSAINGIIFALMMDYRSANYVRVAMAGSAIFMIKFWIFLFITTRIVMGRPRHSVIHFFRRANVYHWGEDLKLAGFTPGSVNAAILAALLPRLVRRIFLMGACWALLTTAFIAANSTPRGLGAEEWGYIGLIIFYWALTWALFSGLEAFDVVCALRESDLSTETPPDEKSRARKFWENGLALFKTIGLPFIAGAVASGLMTLVLDRSKFLISVLPICVIGVVTVAWSLQKIRRWITRTVNLR